MSQLTSTSVKGSYTHATFSAIQAELLISLKRVERLVTEASMEIEVDQSPGNDRLVMITHLIGDANHEIFNALVQLSQTMLPPNATH